MTSTNRDEVRIVGRSVRGPGHIEDDIPKQDSFATKKISDDLAIVAVGDGLGNAKLSDTGSEVATREVCSVLKSKLESTEDLNQESLEDIFYESFNQARAAVRKKAKKLDEPTSEFETTLLAVIVGPFGIAGAAVGDGGIVYELEDSYELLVEREMALVDLAASNYTYTLLDDEWPSFRTGFTKNCDGVVIFSDGVEEYVWGGLDSVMPEFFDGVFEIVRKINDTNRASKKLEELLTNDDFSELSDDKTVVIIDLPLNFNLGGIETESGEQVSIGEPVMEDIDNTYRIDDSENRGAKLFHPDVVEAEKLYNKIQAMIDHPPKYSTNSDNNWSIAWPTDILRNSESGDLLGYRTSLPEIGDIDYLMNFAKEYSALNSENINWIINILIDNIGISNRAEFSHNRYQLAHSLAKGVDAIHQTGHAIGNFHHSKILVNENKVVFIDSHEFHIKDEEETYTGSDIASDYAPSIDDCSTIKSVQKSDRFGLAVHIFQILMNGYHPFEISGSKLTEDQVGSKIDNNPFPYRLQESEYLSPPDEAPSYSKLPSEIQELFKLCFIEGKEIPVIRPPAKKWVEALSNR